MMPLREFLRGGYQVIVEPTVITKRGYPEFTVFPAGPRNKALYFHTDEQSDTLRPGPTGPSPNGG
jgi:hypothetical protein